MSRWLYKPSDRSRKPAAAAHLAFGWVYSGRAAPTRRQHQEARDNRIHVVTSHDVLHGAGLQINGPGYVRHQETGSQE